jgi:hypothetical protein
VVDGGVQRQSRPSSPSVGRGANQPAELFMTLTDLPVIVDEYHWLSHRQGRLNDAWRVRETATPLTLNKLKTPYYSGSASVLFSWDYLLARDRPIF